MKIILDNVTNIDSITTINANFDKIEQELQNKILYRDNPVGEPNTLEDDLDVNGKTLYNIGNIETNGDLFAPISEVQALVDEAEDFRNGAAASAIEAGNSAALAITQANNAAASYDAFDDRYLGSKSSPPTLDNDGNALLVGALYFDTVSNRMKVRSVSNVWIDVSLDAASFAGPNGATLIGYTSNYMGSVTRLLSAKLNEWVSLTDFGADPTGAVECAAQFNNAVRAARFLWCSPGTYLLNPRHMLYDDGAYQQVTRVGVSIPSNTTILGYGATINSTNTNNDSYSLLASFRTSNVHIKGLKLIGDRDTNTSNPAVPNDYGFGIDFRDVTDCSVEDCESSKMWGDAFYLGVTDTGGTGSNIVRYLNIHGHDCRRQGLSITGGQNITVAGYLFERISGASAGPAAGIDIEPNTTALCQNITIVNGTIRDCNFSILAYKVQGLVIDQLIAENCVQQFPVPGDRVFDFDISGVTCRGGAASNYGILWQERRTLSRGRISNFSITGSKLYDVLITDESGFDFSDITFSDGQIYGYTGGVMTSQIDVAPSSVLFERIKFIYPLGILGTNLTPAGRILSNSGGRLRNCEFINRDTVLSLAISYGLYGNQGNIHKGLLTFTKDALSLQNSWTTVGGYEGPYYTRDSEGRVELYGVITGGTTTAGTVIATLPDGFRPIARVMNSVVNDSGSVVTTGVIYVETNGNIVTGPGFLNNRVSLDGVAFNSVGVITS